MANTKIYSHRKRETEIRIYSRIGSQTLKAAGSDLGTMHGTESTETVSLCKFCNLFTEGHILCIAREKASNTAFLLKPRGCVCVVMIFFVL